MDKFLTIVSGLLLVVSIYLLVIDSYFSSLTLFLVGILSVLNAWIHRNGEQRTMPLFYMGLAIIIITYVAEFIAGYINQDTIAIYQELNNQK